MASKLKHENYDGFALPLPINQDIKIAIKSLCRAYKGGAISETIFNKIIKILMATSIENDIADKLLAKSRQFDDKINRRGRLLI